MGRVTGYPSRVGLTPKKIFWIGSRVNPFLLRVKKMGFGSYIFRVRSGQKILTRIAMFSWNPLDNESWVFQYLAM